MCFTKQDHKDQEASGPPITFVWNRCPLTYLTGELVTREAQNAETLGFCKLVMQSLQLRVVGVG